MTARAVLDQRQEHRTPWIPTNRAAVEFAMVVVPRPVFGDPGVRGAGGYPVRASRVRSAMGSDYQEPFDGDKVPREIVWKKESFRRAFAKMANWRVWHREYRREHNWINQKQTEGQKGWRLYRQMVQVIAERPLSDLNGNPPMYHFKALDPPLDGLFSMRYNLDIRLVFRFFEEANGKACVKVVGFGFHYEDIKPRKKLRRSVAPRLSSDWAHGP